MVREMLSDPAYLPPMLPSSSIMLRRLSGLSHVQISDVVPILEWDPLLAASAMRVALSAMPNGDPPPTLQATVDLLGLSNISTLAFGTVFKSQVFRNEHYGEVLEQIRKHSVATARAARMIASDTAVADYAFTCGLLHDIGTSVTVLALAKSNIRLDPDELGPVLASVHEEVGAILVDAWKLSPDLKRGIDGHHFPETREGALVRVADAIAAECGGGTGADIPRSNDRRSFVAACALLKLTAPAYAQLLDASRSALDR